jgi:dolichol-phosphate mannosyltransferase
MKTVSIVVPVYFNEGSLPALADELQAVETQLAARQLALQLIFVDDGSRDGSWPALLAIRQRRPATTLIRLTRNFGAVRASKTGLQFATGDCFMILAADLQDPPELILEMTARWQRGSKFVTCVRAGREDPFWTRLWAWLYYRLVRWLVIADYPLGGYDLALMDRALLPHFQQSSKSLFTPLLGFWLGYPPDCIAYHRRKRGHGKSRWTLRKKFGAFLDSILGYSAAPLRLLSGFGLLVSGLSFGYGIWMIGAALRGKTGVPGFATIVVLLSFFMGLVIAMLSVIGEYLWRIFDEVNQRPETVIAEVQGGPAPGAGEGQS